MLGSQQQESGSTNTQNQNNNSQGSGFRSFTDLLTVCSMCKCVEISSFAKVNNALVLRYQMFFKMQASSIEDIGAEYIF